MTNDSAELIFAIVATILGGLALALSTIALALIVGIKNSTHQVLWKPVEAPGPEDEEEDEELPVVPGFEGMLNPNKKFKLHQNETPKEETEFADLSDPAVTSGF